MDELSVFFYCYYKDIELRKEYKSAIDEILGSDHITIKNDRNQNCVRDRFSKGLTHSEVGKIYGISRERVRQIIARFKYKLILKIGKIEGYKEYAEELRKILIDEYGLKSEWARRATWGNKK